MLILRSLAFNAFFYLHTIAWLIGMLPTLLMSKAVTLACVKQWARINRWSLGAIAGVRVEIRGLENVPTTGAIIASKHQSTFETVALLDLFRDPTYVLKRELLRIPLFGRYAQMAEQIAVDRTAGRAALTEMAARAKAEATKGRQIIIYPEGTRRPAGAPPAYKHGVAHLYRELGVPMVPVALNAGLFWGRHQFLRHPGTLVLEFLPAIPPGLPMKVAFAAMCAAIETGSDRLIREALAADDPPPLPPEGRDFLARTAAATTAARGLVDDA
ncbi:1-acyl-sn-glycerol-3-phosphate acyltransferase [Siculibacillus lacustris]|uniref:1-acyl-sn-glycerol-3-phosphate acyltransferase n=1 Tax=Siculibacillus lacustris TaxID=1549641 RepID=A0A4Q9VG45_9HYPH|nr:lysophospholipid acyltransferase family protein [Siculibacillus lacustris]TBW33964.1 1-acyl-sn-glycerol-3-phosphate acyltransferase [Siculibacillus lacustris]